MKSKNINFVQNIAKELCKKSIIFGIIDERWKTKGDIDLIVARKDFGKLKKILKEKGFCKQGLSSPWTRTFKKRQNDEIIDFGIHISGYNNSLGLRAKEVSKLFEPKKAPEKEKYHLSTEKQILIILYKVSYNTDNKSSKYEEYYQKLLNKKIDWEKLSNLASKLFLNPEKIISKVKTKEKLNKIQFKIIKKYKRRENLLKIFYRTIRILYKIILPSPYLAIIGTDGSGKTTTTDGLAEKLRENKLKVITIYGGRIKGQILPIKKVGGMVRKDYKRFDGGRPEKKEMIIYNSRIIRFFTPILYYFDYILRYLLRIFPARLKYDYVLTDRSFIDIFASPNTNKNVCKLLINLMPSPKHILIWIEPEIAEKRRPDHPAEDIDRQLKEYRKLKKKYILILKTDRNKEEIINKIFNKIIK